MSALNPIFCGVDLDRTPLLTRVRVLPWQKDILQEVLGEERRRENGKRKIEREREKDPCRIYSCRSVSEGRRLFVGETDVWVGVGHA